jgi:RNA polymerase sigma factor (sigma-70 family)
MIVKSTVKSYLSKIGSIPVMDHSTLVDCFKVLDDIDESLGISKFEKEKELEDDWNIQKLFDQIERASTNSDVKKQIREYKRVREHIVVSNLRLVVSIAKQYKTSDELPLIDLIQEGNVGLMKAVRRYDWKRGYRFSTYATWWIRQAISLHIAKHKRTVRLPCHAIGVQRRIMKAIEDHNDKTGQTPTLDELKELLSDVSEKVLEATLHAGMGTVSLNAQKNSNSGEECSCSLENKLFDEKNDPFDLLSHAEIFDVISSVMKELSLREAAVVRMRFGLYDAGLNREDYLEKE